MGIPDIDGLLEYLAPFIAFQKLLIADNKHYNLHLLERVNGDGKFMRTGPLFLWNEANWNEAEFANALFKPPSKRFLELQPPFLKYHSTARKYVTERYGELKGDIPKDSIYGRYLLHTASESEKPSWFQRLKNKLRLVRHNVRNWWTKTKRDIRNATRKTG